MRPAETLATAALTLALFGLASAVWPEHEAAFGVLAAGQLFNTLVVKQIPGFDELAHRTIIEFPRWLRCPANINCKGRGCDASAEGYENQGHASFDGFMLGHLLMWAGVGMVDPDLSVWVVVLFSVAFEAAEAVAGCMGARMHARVTDVLVNTLGFLIGSALRV